MTATDKKVLMGLTNAALVVEFNKLAELPALKHVPIAKIKGWKGKKDDLVARIVDLQKKAKPGSDQRPTRTIREAAEEMLLHVVEEKDGRKIGYRYEEILDKIEVEFGSNTTVACLRWYAVHLNKDPKVRMPLRPRKRVER